MDRATRIRHVTAVLGPTNTGKTHLAIERMLDHETGMIGLPLRLLAREVYDKIAARVGAASVALITGEEKIKPEGARYWVCTVEAMPRDIAVDFLAIDEIQLAADAERGHVFTDRLLNMRGQLETLVLGAQTMREVILDLMPGANFIARPRLSKLTYVGQKKITRLPARSAIVAFSASDVYAIAELIRRQRGGAAVVLGALSPRTRNAQVALYQSGDVDFLVATDAVGMGLNLDVDHVAFSALRKFDGHHHRNLFPTEMGQIAGRAGRHLNDGTFGVTGDVEPLDADLIERLESHTFDPLKVLQWRNTELDFATLDRLRDSLRVLPSSLRLTRVRMADDVTALENVSHDRDVVDAASSPANVMKLWEVCQIPDYRKISSQTHAEMVSSVYRYLMSSEGHIDEDWFAKQVAHSDKTDGDIDTLSNRLAHIRTWTFVANRDDWLRDPAHWQERTRAIEDNLSDALHDRLTQRFVDARTSALMKGLKANDDLDAEIGDDGAISVENHFVGRLSGFRFSLDPDAEGVHQKAARHAAVQVLSKELAMRVRRVVAAKDDAFRLEMSGNILWRGELIGRLEPGEDPLKPQVVVISDDHLSIADRDRVQQRLSTWITAVIADKLKPLVELSTAEDITGLTRGIAYQLTENLGVIRRTSAASEIRSLDQTARAQLRRFGLRFGAFNLFFPVLMKPAAAELLLALWCLKHAEQHGLDRNALPEAPRAGLTSVAAVEGVPEAFYQAYGFHLCGPRAVRIDILERLADLIRPLMSWRASEERKVPPKGATGDGAFTVTPEMMSILGCSPDELGHVLRVLGFRSETRPAPVVEAEPPVADAVPEAVSVADNETSAAVSEPAEIETPETGPSAEPEQTPAIQNGESAIQKEVAEAVDSAVAPSDTVAQASGPASTERAESVAPPSQSGDAIEVSADAGDPAQTATTESAGSASDVGATDEGSPYTEPQTIEVWRPRRRQDETQRPRGQRRRRGQRQATEGGEATADRTQQGDAAKRDGADGSDGRQHKDGGRSGGDDRGRRSGGRRDEDRTRNPRHGKGRPEGGKGGGRRRGDDDGRASRPRVHSSGPAKSGGVDPDSPFAALSALKEALDKPDQNT
jgi:ATP-dependent RNA helicase SUPV3L1/SUV3